MLIVVGIIISAVGCGFAVWWIIHVSSQTASYSSYITAKTAFERAREIAIKWNSTAQLDIEVTPIGSPANTSDGRCEGWHFIFSALISPTMYGILYISVYGNGRVYTYSDTANITSYSWVSSPIYNWTIDSDEALQIATHNDTIQQFLSNIPEAKIEIMELSMMPKLSDNAVWHINWFFSGILDSPCVAEIMIDAWTGKILRVWASPVGHMNPWYYPTLNNPYLVCWVLPITILVVIIVVIVVVERKWKKKRRLR